MADNTTAENGRDWIKITAIALIPTLAAALVVLMLNGNTPEASAQASESTTTTLAFEAGPSGSDADDLEISFDSDADVVEEDGQDPEPEQQPEQDQDDEPQPPAEPPAPAAMDMPSEVEVSGNTATIPLTNTGEEPLEVYLVDVDGHPIEVGEVATEVAGGDTENIELTIDPTDLPFGSYEMDVSVSTNDGVGQVTVKGFKILLVLPILPNVDISENYVVPHQANLLAVKMTNDEAHSVTVGLSSEDDRLAFPAEVELAPGENTVNVSIQALAVPSNVIDVLQLTVTYGESELGTVTITKHGS